MTLFADEPGAPPEVPAKASYLALARRYRPAAFDDVIGQTAAISTLKNAVATGRLHHAYLFSGIRGVGKTTAARLFARALNCAKGPTPTPCGECDPCREIASGFSMDVIEIDAASNRGVDDVEPLREAARYAPSRDRYKIFILDEVHMLSNAAFNSLLKILEEPPPRIVWILATTEHRKVPPTVVSRCQHFEFHRVARAEIVSCLERIAARESVTVDRAGLEVIAAAAAGSVRDAVSLLDQTIAYAGPRATVDDVRSAIGAIDRRGVLEFLRLVAARDAAGLLERIAALAEEGAEFSQFTSALVTTARDTAVARFTPAGSKALNVTADEEKELRELAASFSDDGLLRVFNALLDLPFAIRNAAQPRFVLEAAALRLARLADLAPIEDVIARLQGGSAPAVGGASRAGGPAAGPPPRLPQAAPSAGVPPALPPDAAPPAAAVAPIAPGDAGGFRERLLTAIQSRKMSLRTYLEMARRVSLDGDVVEIAFSEKQRFFKEALDTADARAAIEGVASEIAGRPVLARTTLEAPAQDEPAPAAGSGKRDRLIETAMKQPEVRMVMETFRGQIVDIQEIS